MTTDRDAVIWTRLGGQPRRIGRLYITDRECRFTYDDDFLETTLPGLGIVYAPEFFGKTTIVRARSELFDLLPPLQSLIPPRQADNFQRNLAFKCLAAKGITGLGGFDADWEIVKIAGHGGIGHLDLFENDTRAQDWYNDPAPVVLHEISDELGFTLKEFMSWYEDDLDILIQTVGPTPTVGGAIPRLLMSIPSSGCDGRIEDHELTPEVPREVPMDGPATAGPPAFESSREAVTLLPFDVRLRRVADAVGVSTEDALLADLRSARLELGAHDYAEGIPPDLTWTARRMTRWARALRPVCESPTFRERYPDLRDSMEEFTLAAYGRRATPEDYEAFDASVADAGGLSEEAVYRAMCIGLLSSTELVAR